MENFDVIIIGGGQSGLAVGYYLRRTGLSYIILDNSEVPGGAWVHTWKSLRLFSPAQWSSLPGVLMAGGSNYYPTRDEAIDYLNAYEIKYKLPVRRKVEVVNVIRAEDGYLLETSAGQFLCITVVSATGSFRQPYLPAIDGMEQFAGEVIHSSQYRSPEGFKGQKVAVVGEGNSGAQILAEVSGITDTLWVTLKDPTFLPDHIDGRYLFDAATQMYEAQKAGRTYTPPSLGDIVMVDPVKDARSRGVLKSVRPFDHFTRDTIVWTGKHEERVGAVIFCTGFRPALKHLSNLGIVNSDGKVSTAGTKAKQVDGLWLVGYGNWTGFASATLIGVGRSAKKTVEEILEYTGK